MLSKHLLTAVISGLIISTAAHRVFAQEAPYGSCILPTGQWCWPQLPGDFGEPCTCVTPDGNLFGTIN